MKLSYSTSACPDWSLERAVEAAREFGYDGIELRLIDGVVIDPRAQLAELGRLHDILQDLPVASLDTSIKLALDGPEWIEEFEAFTELSSKIGHPLIRLWGGDYVTSLDHRHAVAQVGQRLDQAAQISAKYGVRVALEMHDAFRSVAVAAKVLEHVTESHVGLLWDIQNTYAVGLSSPEDVWRALGHRIVQIHVKDAKPGEGVYGELTLLGEGTVPAEESIAVLAANGFDGWVSVNWLKFQYPSLIGPDVALPQHAQVLRKWWARAEKEFGRSGMPRA